MQIWILIDQSLYDDYDVSIHGVYDNRNDAKTAFINTLYEYGLTEDDADMDSLCYNDNELKIEVRTKYIQHKDNRED